MSNLGAGDTCVGVELNVLTQTNCNLQANAYLGSYDPANICTDYLADPGLSSGIPPSPTSMTFEVPGGANFVVVVHTTNPGEIGCQYELRVRGDLCELEAAPALGWTGMLVAVLALFALGAIGLVRRTIA